MRAFLLSRALRFAPVRGAAVLMLVTMVLLGGAGAGIAMSRLTPDQVNSFYMGDHDASVMTSVSVLPGDASPDLKQVALSAGAASVSQVLVLQGLPLDQVRSAIFYESDWPHSGFTAQFRLLDGRWPQRPGEVVASGIDGDMVSAWSQKWQFTVVGHARSINNRVPAILAATGTFQSLRFPGPAEEFPTLAASPWVAWTGGDTNKIVEALAQATGADPGMITSTQLSRRADAARSSNWFYEVLPSLLVPLVVGFIAATLVFRWARRRADGLRRQGVSPRRLYSAFLLVLGILATLTTVGYPLGWIGGFAMSPLWSVAVEHDIVFQDPNILPIAVEWLALLAACVTSAAWISRRPAGTVVSWFSVDKALRVGFVVVGVGCVVLASFTGKTMQRGAVLVLAILIAAALAPYGLGLIRSFRPDNLAARLGLRVLQRDRAAVSITTAILAAAVGLPVGLATYGISAANELTRAASIQPAPTGAAILQSPVSDTVPAGVVEKFQTATGLSDPIIMQGIQLDIPSAYGSSAAVLPDLDSVSRWLERPLDADETAVLKRGGALTLGDVDGAVSVRQPDGSLRSTEFRKVSFREKNYGVTTVFVSPYANLSSTRVIRYYTGVSQELEQNMVALLSGAQIDRTWVAFHNIPSVFGLSTMASLALALTGFVGSLVLLVAASSQARTLRGYSAAFTVLGIPRSWIRRVYAYSFWPGVLLGVLCGLLAAIIGIGVITIIAGISLVVPWFALAGWATGMAAGCLASAALGFRRVLPRERMVS